METSGNTKTLSAPSMVVMNNQAAHIQVGDQIPINQTSVNTGIGTTTSYNQVQYINTGVILNVQPRINPGGLVYMNISQQVSQADQTQVCRQRQPDHLAARAGDPGGGAERPDGAARRPDPAGRGQHRHRHSGTQPDPGSWSSVRQYQPQPQPHRADRADHAAGDSRQRGRQADHRRVPEQVRVAGAAACVAHRAAARPAAAITPLPALAAPAASWPEQLQQHAEDALRQSDYATAQDLAMQSWKQGTHHGSLCQRNWQVIMEARKHSNRLGSVDAAAQAGTGLHGVTLMSSWPRLTRARWAASATIIRAMTSAAPVFPITPLLPQISASLAEHPRLVLEAPPGAGKTTQVPLALLDAPWLAGRKIVMLEPRRIAARAAAQFMAQQLGETVGQTVGYRIRFESRVSAATRDRGGDRGHSDPDDAGRSGAGRGSARSSSTSSTSATWPAISVPCWRWTCRPRCARICACW